MGEVEAGEVVEIAWLVMNVLGQGVDLGVGAGLEKALEELLTLAEKLLLLRNLEVMDILFRSITTFFQHVDQYFQAADQPKGQV